MIHDQHIHTKYSVDSKQEIEPLVQKAISNNAKYFVSCDHTDFDLANYHQDWLVDFKKYDEEIEELKVKYPMITFLKGVELGYRKDHLDDMNKILERKFDLVNMSIHDDGIHDYYKVSFFQPDKDKVMNIYLDNILDGVTTFDNFDVLSHIDYGFKTCKLLDPTSDFFKYQDKISEILKVLIKKEKTLEVNIKVQNVVNDENCTHLRKLLALYKSLGGTRVSLSSDSHVIDAYMTDFDKYQKVIKECGFSYLCYYVNRQERHYEIQL